MKKTMKFLLVDICLFWLCSILEIALYFLLGTPFHLVCSLYGLGIIFGLPSFELRKRANDCHLGAYYSDIVPEIRNTSKHQFHQIISEAAATSPLPSVIDVSVINVVFLFSRCSNGVFRGSVLWHPFCHCSLLFSSVPPSQVYHSFLELQNVF